MERLSIRPGLAIRDEALGAMQTLQKRDRMRDDHRSAIAEIPALVSLIQLLE